MKEEVIKKIKEADISQDDWQYGFLEIMTDNYAKGYIVRMMEELARHVEYNSDQFRNNILAVCEYDIWGK